MNTTVSPTAVTPARLEESIPDYVRGVLSAEQGAVIAQQQASDTNFAALILQEQTLQSHFGQLRADATVPPASFARLRERLQRPTLLDRLKRWLLAPAALRPSWATAAALAVLVAVVGLWRAPPPADKAQTLAATDAAPYQTLTTADPATPAGAEWRLVFAPETSSEARAALLQEFGLQALSAPDALGSLWVRSAVADAELAHRLQGDARLMVVQAAPRQRAP